MGTLEKSVARKPKGWGARHTVAILGFWGMAFLYSMRFNLSLAIVAMVRSKRQDNATLTPGDSIEHQTCSHLLANQTTDGVSGAAVSDSGEFDWSPAEQGFILGSFFWGYVSTQLCGGLLSSRFGGKWPMGIGLLITAVFALLTPVAARTHQYLLVAVRVIQGMGQGITIPAMHTILAKWAPAEEKSIMTSTVYAGTTFGTAATLIISGYLIDANVFGGWPSVFYVFGAVTLIWFILWWVFFHDTPADHPSISPAELAYIQESLGTTETPKRLPIPWKSISTSMPLWAIQIGHAGHCWGLYTLLTEMPTYMKTVLHFDIKQSSWMSAMPYIVMWIVSIISSQLADFLIERKIVRTVVIRKSAQAISQVGAAAALIAAAYTGCDRVSTVGMLTFGVGISGVIYAGFIANHAEIASNHAGVLMGITNTFANLCGFAAPYAAGLILDKEASLENWKIVFFLAAGIYVFNSIFYGLFASATEQPWNKPQKDGVDRDDGQLVFSEKFCRIDADDDLNPEQLNGKGVDNPNLTEEK